jgi:hypothetical protein
VKKDTFHPIESPREAKPLFLFPSPSPSKERGIKGVRLPYKTKRVPRKIEDFSGCRGGEVDK